VGGTGETIEHAVRMRQFDTHEELDRLLADGRVQPGELATFGERLADAHDRFASVAPGHAYGSVTAVCRSLLENVGQLKTLSARAGLACDLDDIECGLRRGLEQSSQLIEARWMGGRVKECHGDLHCRNVVRSSGRLVAFDGLEFEPAFRWIDVAEEIAFLFMDLSRRGGQAHANAFLNGYLARSGDFEATRLVRLYGAHRALVRAKVAAVDCTAANASKQREQLRSDHAAYIAVAGDLLNPRNPRIVLMTGLSGSGKTWLARQLTPRMGAIHVRSDVERKRLASLPAHASSRSGIDQGLYSPDASVDTYRRLAACAANIIAGGFCALVDATFQRRADRALFSKLSADAGASLVLVRCRAPIEVLRARVVERSRKGGDASEADLAVLEHQQATFEAIDPGEALEVIDADTTRDTVVQELEAALHEQS
jgi:hypothetical protein